MFNLRVIFFQSKKYRLKTHIRTCTTAHPPFIAVINRQHFGFVFDSLFCCNYHTKTTIPYSVLAERADVGRRRGRVSALRPEQPCRAAEDARVRRVRPVPCIILVGARGAPSFAESSSKAKKSGPPPRPGGPGWALGRCLRDARGRECYRRPRQVPHDHNFL